MADLSQTISIIFGAIDKGVGGTITGITDGLDKLDAKIGRVAQPLSDIADSALKAEGALAALALTAAGVAVAAATKFETAQLDLKKVLDETDPSVQSFTATVDELSVKYGESATSILQGIANFKQAGFAAKDAADLQKNALDLVIAGDLDASEASDLLIRTLKGFEQPATSAAAVIDSLNEVSNKYATDVKQLATGLADLSPVAKAAGLSFQETEAILTPVIEVFGSGSEAADALKTGLLKLIDDSKPVADALASIGVSQKDANDNLRPAKDILHDVSSAFQTLDDKQKLFVTGQLVGIDQSAKMVKVFDNLKTVTDITAVAMDSQGSAAKEVAIRLESAEVMGKRVVTAFENLARTAGGEILKNMTGLGGGLVDIEVALKKVVDSGGLAPLLAAIQPQLNDLAALFKTVATNLPDAFKGLDFSNLLNSIDGLSGEVSAAFDAVFGKIDLSTPQGLETALQRIVDGIAALTNIVTGIVSSLQPAFQTMGAIINEVERGGTDTEKVAGQILGAGKAFTLLSPILDGVTGSLNLFAGALSIIAGKQAVDAVAAIGKLVDPMLLLKGGAVAAAGVLGYEAGTSLAGGIDEVVKRLTGSESLGTLIYDLTHSTEDFNKAAPDAAANLADIGASAKEAAAETKKFEPIDLGDLDPVAAAMKRLVDTTIELNHAQDGIGSILDGIIDKRKQEAEGLITAEERARGYHVEINDMGEAVIHVGNQLDAKAAKHDKDAEAMKKAQEEAQKFQLKMMELASNERIKLIESNVKLNVAEMENDTKRVEAAFHSIDNTITSTGDTLKDLFGAFNAAGSEWDKSFIQDVIKQELKMRQDAFELQKRLTDEQIRTLQVRRERLLKGDTLIKIDAGEIEPALEIIWDTIMRKAQVKANAEGVELLLPA